MLNQQRNIIGPLSKRRQFNREHLQAIIQILAKVAFFYHRLQVLIGRCDHAYVDANRLAASHSLERAVLQQSQDLCLRRAVISPISSKKIVPPLICSNFPMWRLSAPVKEPRSCPKIRFPEVSPAGRHN